MLFAVRMDVRLPHDLDPAVRDDLMSREAARGAELKATGKRRHVWRVVGHVSNLSIFDVDSTDELHELLAGLPLFPYTDMDVTPLAAHPSDPSGG